MGRQYFTDDDFAAIARKHAASEAPSVICARKRVVEEKFRPLHEGFGGAQGLGRFMAQHGLCPHWRKEHLTNVYWPALPANGGWVDYLRMGYGKEERLVRELVRRSQVYTELTHLGTYDQMGFQYVTQLQIGLQEGGWWINLYLDDKAWLEQQSLLRKMESPAKRRQWLALLQELVDVGYALCLYFENERDVAAVYSEPAEFTGDLRRFHREGQTASISVELFLNPDDRANDAETILEFIQGEFAQLLPLYEFVAWHPVKNNHLGL